MQVSKLSHRPFVPCWKKYENPKDLKVNKFAVFALTPEEREEVLKSDFSTQKPVPNRSFFCIIKNDPEKGINHFFCKEETKIAAVQMLLKRGFEEIRLEPEHSVLFLPSLEKYAQDLNEKEYAILQLTEEERKMAKERFRNVIFDYKPVYVFLEKDIEVKDAEVKVFATVIYADLLKRIVDLAEKGFSQSFFRFSNQLYIFNRSLNLEKCNLENSKKRKIQ